MLYSSKFINDELIYQSTHERKRRIREFLEKEANNKPIKIVMPPELNKKPQKHFYDRKTPIRLSNDSKGGAKGNSMPPESLTEKIFLCFDPYSKVRPSQTGKMRVTLT